MRDNLNPTTPDLDALEVRATNLRRHMLTMARGQGAGLHRPGPRHRRPRSPRSISTSCATTRPISSWPERDRFLLSTGHYSIALWAALAEAGILPVDGTLHLRRRRQPPRDVDARHDARRRDDRRLARPRPRPGRRAGARPAARRLGGARLRRTVRRRDAGGLDLGGRDVGAAISSSTASSRSSTATASRPTARSCSTWSRSPTNGAPSAGRRSEIDGNDMAAIVDALAAARVRNGKPKAIVLRTLPGKGVPTHREPARRRISSASIPANGTAHRRVRTQRGEGQWLTRHARWPWARTRRRPRAAPASRRRSARRWRGSAARGRRSSA